MRVDADDPLAPHADFTQRTRQLIGAALQFPIAQGLVALAHRETLRDLGHLRLEQTLEETRRLQRHGRTLLEDGDARALFRPQQGDAAQTLVEVGKGVAGEDAELLQPERGGGFIQALDGMVQAQGFAFPRQAQQRQAGSVQRQLDTIDRSCRLQGKGVFGRQAVRSADGALVKALQPGACFVQMGAEAFQGLAQ
ncbi:hypothetical protein FQZ97_766170 [compost metagenome]